MDRAPLGNCPVMPLILAGLPLILQGLLVTVTISLAVLLLGTLLGIVGSLSLLYGANVLRWCVRIYVDVCRSIPHLVMIFAIFYGLPALGLQVPAIVAGILALGLFCGAHMSEIFRGGVESIPHGQMDAAKSIGLTFAQRLRQVIFPQALGRILPAWVNTAVEIVKSSSLVSLVSVVDLTMAIQQIVGRTREALLFYAVAAALYFAINFTLSITGRRLEKKFAHG
ncbi:MAG: amino acid ABC transporter permease [Burkholderiales bacterium]|jgi:polar amino acid transport system permease protein